MPPWMIVTLVGLVGLIGYVIECMWWPYGRCWCCGGTGKHFRSDGKVFRDCNWVCKGSGRRIRVGLRIWHWIRSAKDDAS